MRFEFCPFIYPSVCLSVHLSVCLSSSPPPHPLSFLSLFLSLSECLFVYLPPPASHSLSFSHVFCRLSAVSKWHVRWDLSSIFLSFHPPVCPSVFLSHSLIHFFTHSFTCSLTHSLTHSFIHFLCLSLCLSVSVSLCRPALSPCPALIVKST